MLTFFLKGPPGLPWKKSQVGGKRGKNCYAGKLGKFPGGAAG